jgi:hypothetical protein
MDWQIKQDEINSIWNLWRRSNFDDADRANKSVEFKNLAVKMNLLK